MVTKNWTVQLFYLLITLQCGFLMPHVVSIVAEAAKASSKNQLEFVTSLSYRGCPLFVHRVGTVKQGHYVLEPTVCITDMDALKQATARSDPLTNQMYLSFPVTITDMDAVSAARQHLHHLLPKKVTFFEVISIQLSSIKGAAFKSLELIWDPTERVGSVRVDCSASDCQTLALHLWKDHFELIDSIKLEITMRPTEGCRPVERAFPVTVARAPFLPIDLLQRPRSSPLRACSDLQLFRVVQLDNCTAYVHRRPGKRGHFVIEPLLCPTPNFQLLRDFSLGSHYVSLPALIEDASVIASVRSRIGSASVESMEFMKLWNAIIHVSSRLSQWRFEPLRLSVDRRTAELRAYCSSQEYCSILGSVLRSEPVNFWKNVQWTAVSTLDDECEFHSTKRRFARRMRDRPMGGLAAVQRRTNGRWSAQELRDRTISRDGRTFMIIDQRGCRASNFKRSWREYVAGFGDESNFWIGLDIIRSLTSWQGTVMRVEMLLWNETEWFAEYSGFTVGNASTNYRMRYSEIIKSKSNLVHNSLESGVPFSTRDTDNIGYSSRGYCSRSWGGSGGWWYGTSCGRANPNGVYYFGWIVNRASYSSWYFLEGFRSLKEFRMMVQI